MSLVKLRLKNIDLWSRHISIIVLVKSPTKSIAAAIWFLVISFRQQCFIIDGWMIFCQKTQCYYKQYIHMDVHYALYHKYGTNQTHYIWSTQRYWNRVFGMKLVVVAKFLWCHYWWYIIGRLFILALSRLYISNQKWYSYISPHSTISYI